MRPTVKNVDPLFMSVGRMTIRVDASNDTMSGYSVCFIRPAVIEYDSSTKKKIIVDEALHQSYYFNKTKLLELANLLHAMAAMELVE